MSFAKPQPDMASTPSLTIICTLNLAISTIFLLGRLADFDAPVEMNGANIVPFVIDPSFSSRRFKGYFTISVLSERLGSSPSGFL